MVESVDTKDLKSFGYCSCAGSSPASSTGVLCFVLKINGLEKTDCKKVRQKSAKGFLKQKRPPISLDKQPFVCIKNGFGHYEYKGNKFCGSSSVGRA